MLRIGCLAILGFGIFLPFGCSLPYLLRQASGQVEMLAAARPVSEVLAESECSPGERARLETLAGALSFAARRGFHTDGAYDTVVPKDARQKVYVLAAAPPDRLVSYLWRFPLVGALPYKGFFDLEAARREERLLLAQGFETRLDEAAAYSTLGWLPDPIVRSMVDAPLGQSLEVLFHELTHRTVFIAGDSRFNENIASFVGEKMARQYLTERAGADEGALVEYSRSVADERRFLAVARKLRGRLETAFQDPDRGARLAERERCFAEANAELASLPFESERHRGGQGVNWSTPLLLSIDMYTGEGTLLEEALARCEGRIEKLLQVLRAMPSQGTPTERLRAWLAQGTMP